MKWHVDDQSPPTPQNLDRLANSFLSGNGSLGLRAVLDEHGKDGKAGILINGLYDQVPGRWREPINAPHPLGFRVIAQGVRLDVLTTTPRRHVQSLDLTAGIQSRSTEFVVEGAVVTVTSRRWVSQAHPQLLQAEWEVSCDQAIEISVETGIDGDVWDINGPHLEAFQLQYNSQTLGVTCRTQEAQKPVVVMEHLDCSLGMGIIVRSSQEITRQFRLPTEPGKTFRFRKMATVNCFDTQPWNSGDFAHWEEAHREQWKQRWEPAQVEISGDEEADFALRFSLYHLLTTAPTAKSAPGLSIPARGVSGQVYKGAVFWDTELFMLPFFLATDPSTARRLIQYRIQTLPGALKKAREEGHQGAFYAWESQEGGHDACTLFNVNDVFTGRPLRTFFRDKQIHISADVALAIDSYVKATGDTSVLSEGGTAVILACAEFLLSWMVYRPATGQYELPDVTGPDEYHERVTNDAWTNLTAHKTLVVASALAQEPLRSRLADTLSKFPLPRPGADGVISQFERYLELEDVRPATLKARQKHPHEYWGCGDGLARWTQVIKQADVVLGLALYPGEHSPEVLKSNFEFYEPRTEHGSSLSASAYAILASRLGKTEYAYRYFLKTATVDLSGDSKQYVGDLYIGGTHPAANGGAWMSVVQGFLGLSTARCRLHLDPQLPQKWSSVRLPFQHEGRSLRLLVSKNSVTVEPVAPFRDPLTVGMGRSHVTWRGRQSLVLPLRPQGALFDLDGVLVDTAKYHFLAWKRLADSLGIGFTEADNEHLKGVNRTGSLQRILALGGVERSEKEQKALCEQKNLWYVELVSAMEPSELLPGVVDYLSALRSHGVKIALGSASQNARMILDRMRITSLFDAIVDGTSVTLSKPDPEVFLRGAQELGLPAQACVVYEDSRAGLQAAQRAHMFAIGIGEVDQLPEADIVVSGVSALLE